MKYLYAGIVFCISMVLYMIKRAFENNLVTHEIKLRETPMYNPLKILFISDIHRRKINAGWFSSLPEVDLVLIGGDITEKGVPFERVKRNAALLSNAGEAYFVFGNNDEEIDKEQLISILKNEGIRILENDSAVLENHNHIVLAGIGDINYLKDDLDKTFSGIEHEEVILLSHDPRVTGKLMHTPYQNQTKLILCGHTHGGQIRIFGFGPYEKGRVIKHHHYTQLISNGYGTTLLPMRLGAKSEVHLIHIC
ncbi:metallophosphoesterase [Jeotgalibacillus haloalkalitolerans]|uniref:Metallophosphoesterase family protein n=1 Tax=Jeotgalibacillus haloalkalitolerans TaxID=3104292 RepID=A0ABU5KMU7_9BACL|nr:metallophosphoesterase [Jeotgalibacillus sp. HH7-29]MDZ5712035.1 metallophosphoesterase family protein [Jeotgalibacillus sp. HH7-29]